MQQHELQERAKLCCEPDDDYDQSDDDNDYDDDCDEVAGDDLGVFGIDDDNDDQYDDADAGAHGDDDDQILWPIFCPGRWQALISHHSPDPKLPREYIRNLQLRVFHKNMIPNWSVGRFLPDLM